jgi:hypothetical protein
MWQKLKSGDVLGHINKAWGYGLTVWRVSYFIIFVAENNAPFCEYNSFKMASTKFIVAIVMK